MTRIPLSRLLWLGLLLLVPACTQPANQPASSVEQTHETQERSEATAFERMQHLANLGVSRWHGQGQRGRGVQIAVLDSGFRGYRQFLGTSLPDSIKIRSFRNDRNLEARDSQHGIQCGEILHALAPDAELLFVNWEPDSPQAFINAVRWARAEGAKVMSCSLIMPSWSDGEGGGEVHRALGPLLHDVLFFASAGNTAQRHWCGLFAPNDAGWHQWRDDVVANTLTPWGSERVAVEFYGPTRSTFELSIWHGESGELIGRSILQTDGTKQAGRAVVRFEPAVNTTYQVKIRCVNSPATRMEAFHLVALGGALGVTTPRGSIPFPGDGAKVLAIGAVDARNMRAAYSSCGPNSRLPKPDFVATVPFPNFARKKPFAGTSAAAPQAAGLAALLWSSHDDWTPADVIQSMRGAALDLGPPGHDWETGYGLIRLPHRQLTPEKPRDRWF